MEIKIVSKWDNNKILVAGKYTSIKECLEKNKSAYLEGVNLRGAYLEGADLRGANLRGADLEGAYLGGAKNYYMSHDFAQEIIRRQSIKTFTNKEWSVIGQILAHRICWKMIKENYGKTALSICKKLAKIDFNEFLERMK